MARGFSEPSGVEWMSPMKVFPPERGGISNLDWAWAKCLKEAILIDLLEIDLLRVCLSEEMECLRWK